MKLFYRKIGEGRPLIILHGLFGLGDNWNTISKAFSEKGYCCYITDQRNHGRSPHSDVFNYEVMAEDIIELMEVEKIDTADLIGHSMGGKTLMFLALNHPERIHKMIVADIAPRYYPLHHQSVLAALDSIDLATITSRKEAEEILRNSLHDEATIQFLLKNLYWKDDKKLDWRFGLKEIKENIDEVGKALPGETKIDVPVLFLRGDRSGYINEDDKREILQRFPLSEIRTISNSGHWIHAENPKEFLEVSLEFLLAK